MYYALVDRPASLCFPTSVSEEERGKVHELAIKVYKTSILVFK